MIILKETKTNLASDIVDQFILLEYDAVKMHKIKDERFLAVGYRDGTLCLLDQTHLAVYDFVHQQIYHDMMGAVNHSTYYNLNINGVYSRSLINL